MKKNDKKRLLNQRWDVKQIELLRASAKWLGTTQTEVLRRGLNLLLGVEDDLALRWQKQLKAFPKINPDSLALHA